MTGLPSTAIITSPPVFDRLELEGGLAVEPLSPALSAGLPLTTSAISAPVSVSMPRCSASCG